MPRDDGAEPGDHQAGEDRAVRVAERDIGEGDRAGAGRHRDRVAAAQEQQRGTGQQQRVAQRAECDPLGLVASGHAGAGHLEEGQCERGQPDGAHALDPAALGPGRLLVGHVPHARPPPTWRASAGRGHRGYFTGSTPPPRAVSRSPAPRVRSAREAAADCAKNSPRASTTRLNCPKTSKLTRPKSWAQAATSAAIAGQRESGASSAARRAGVGAHRSGQRAARRRRRAGPPRWASRDHGDQGQADPGARGRRWPAARRSRARASRRSGRTRADGRPPSRGPRRQTATQRSTGSAAPAARPARPRRRRRRVVGVDDEGGEQVVAAGEVAVERGGDHAQLAGDRAQRQACGPLGGQLPSGLLLDRRGHFDSGPFPGSADRTHGLQCATRREHRPRTRALLLFFPSDGTGTLFSSESTAHRTGDVLMSEQAAARDEARLVHRQRPQPHRRLADPAGPERLGLAGAGRPGPQER